MKKWIFILLILFTIHASSEPSILNEVQNWKLLSVLASLISVFLIAFVHMIPFNIPKLKAWANQEAMQVVMTLVIVLFVFSFLSLIDTIYKLEVNSPMSPYTCESDCYISIPSQYLSKLIDSTTDLSQHLFVLGVETMKKATKSRTFSCQNFLVPPCLFGYYNKRSSAGMMLDYERYGIAFETINNVLSSLVIQKFFIENISKVIGPFLFLLGIILRNFFATRRLGGLLFALSLGIMVVFPMACFFTSSTLEIGIYKPYPKEQPAKIEVSCPEFCTYYPPFAYKGSTKIYTYDQFLKLGGTYEQYTSLNSGKSLKEGDFVSCVYLSNHYGCPDLCRELPFPYENPECRDKEKECASIPSICKIIRINTNVETPDCPNACKIIPPLRNDCTICGNISFDCRLAYYEKGAILNKTPGGCFENNESWLKCPKSLDAYKSCMWVIPNNYSNCECKEPFNPPIMKDCSKRCGESISSNMQFYSVGTNLKISKEGMYGRQELQDVAKLLFPAYFFPLVNVLLTLVFIRNCSSFLGGDIELPGWNKVL